MIEWEKGWSLTPFYLAPPTILTTPLMKKHRLNLGPTKKTYDLNPENSYDVNFENNTSVNRPECSR
jgi:hypothetical protein